MTFLFNVAAAWALQGSMFVVGGLILGVLARNVRRG